MKKWCLNIGLSLLTCVYVVSTMGFGVHTCTSDGTASLLLLAGESPCNHEHHSNCEHHHEALCKGDCAAEHLTAEHLTTEQCGEHNASCCHTQVYVLDKAQSHEDSVRMVEPAFVYQAILSHLCSVSCAGFLHAAHGFLVDVGEPDEGRFAAFAPLRL